MRLWCERIGIAGIRPTLVQDWPLWCLSLTCSGPSNNCLGWKDALIRNRLSRGWKRYAWEGSTSYGHCRSRGARRIVNWRGTIVRTLEAILVIIIRTSIIRVLIIVLAIDGSPAKVWTGAIVRQFPC
jgi:hypothetical protein